MPRPSSLGCGEEGVSNPSVNPSPNPNTSPSPNPEPNPTPTLTPTRLWRLRLDHVEQQGAAATADGAEGAEGAGGTADVGGTAGVEGVDGAEERGVGPWRSVLPACAPLPRSPLAQALHEP